MIKHFLKLASAAVLMGALGTANAASITLVLTQDTGGMVTMDILADFSDVTTIGGGFDVATAGLALLDFEAMYPGDPGFSREPDRPAVRFCVRRLQRPHRQFRCDRHADVRGDERRLARQWSGDRVDCRSVPGCQHLPADSD